MGEPADPRSKPLCLRADALFVLRRLREAGHVAYFAGGCVRDLLLGLDPKDYDVATDAPPERVRQLFPRTQAVGQAFGVILVRQGRSVVEVATFRSDGAYIDGRHPASVRFSTAEEDARRRDFTINGLFLDPEADRVIDYVGGQADLKQRLLRAIGEPEQRFAEDHLRLLRAVRFVARFDLSLEPQTAQALGDHAPQLIRISPERIAEELRIVLTDATRVRAWPMLWDYALTDPIFRFLTPAPPGAFDAARSLFLAVAPGERIAFGLALAAACLCHQMTARGSDDPRPLLQRDSIQGLGRAMRKALKISNEELDQMTGILEQLGVMLGRDEPTLAMKKRLMASPVAHPTRQLLRALGRQERFGARMAALEHDLACLERVDCAPSPLVNGEDLLGAGLRAGPAFKVILQEVYDAQLEGQVQTRPAALAMALQRVRDLQCGS